MIYQEHYWSVMMTDDLYNGRLSITNLGLSDTWDMKMVEVIAWIIHIRIVITTWISNLVEYTSLAAPIYASGSIDTDTYFKNYRLLTRIGHYKRNTVVSRKNVR